LVAYPQVPVCPKSTFVGQFGASGEALEVGVAEGVDVEAVAERKAVNKEQGSAVVQGFQFYAYVAGLPTHLVKLALQPISAVWVEEPYVVVGEAVVDVGVQACRDTPRAKEVNDKLLEGFGSIEVVEKFVRMGST
jgi:hypothetical protein